MYTHFYYLFPSGRPQNRQHLIYQCNYSLHFTVIIGKKVKKWNLSWSLELFLKAWVGNFGKKRAKADSANPNIKTLQSCSHTGPSLPHRAPPSSSPSLQIRLMQVFSIFFILLVIYTVVGNGRTGIKGVHWDVAGVLFFAIILNSLWMLRNSGSNMIDHMDSTSTNQSIEAREWLWLVKMNGSGHFYHHF